MSKNPLFNTAEELIEDIRNGKVVILVDDEDRENEGDLVLAADFVTPELVNFMVSQARGLVCLSLTGEQIDRLQLPQMVRDDLNLSPNKTAFTVSIEASHGVSTGISASDRAHTIRVASNPQAKPMDVITPGHIFPIRAQTGGVLRRAGHTEGSVDLARLAGLNPAAVICEVMKDDGSMARVPDLIDFARKHNLKIGTIVDLIEFRLHREVLVEELYSAALAENIQVKIFQNKLNASEHVAVQIGKPNLDEPVLVRVHTDSYTKELYHTLLHEQVLYHQAIRQIEKQGGGFLLLLRGFNATDGIRHELERLVGQQGPPPMDSRDYGIGAQILRLLGVQKIKLLTNKVDKRVGLKAYDLEIVGTVPLND